MDGIGKLSGVDRLAELGVCDLEVCVLDGQGAVDGSDGQLALDTLELLVQRGVIDVHGDGLLARVHKEGRDARQRIERGVRNAVHGFLEVHSEAGGRRQQFAVLLPRAHGNDLILDAAELLLELVHRGSALHGRDVDAAHARRARNFTLVLGDIEGVCDPGEHQKPQHHREGDDEPLRLALSYCFLHNT